MDEYELKTAAHLHALERWLMVLTRTIVDGADQPAVDRLATTVKDLAREATYPELRDPALSDLFSAEVEVVLTRMLDGLTRP